MHSATKSLVLATLVTVAILGSLILLKSHSQEKSLRGQVKCKSEKSAAVRFEEGMRGWNYCQPIDPQEASISVPWRIQ